MWTKTEIAYLAGIIDGEGSIYIQCRKVGNHLSFFPRFQIVNTNKELMYWIHKKFGGILVEKDRSKHNKIWRLQYEWITNRHIMDQLLKLIFPFLICKKEHAKIMMEFRKTFLQKKSFHISSEELSLRNEFMHKLKVLNKRGV